MRTSFSAIETFENCPKKYQFQIIDRIKSPKSKEQIFGTCLHSSLRYLLKKSPLYPTIDELIDFFNVFWEYTAKKIEWRDIREKDILFQEGEKILREFYQKNIPLSSTIVALETRFETEIADDDPKKEPHILAGIIDRIDKLENGQFEIIDYKTNRRLPDKKSIDQNLQLSIYGLGFLKKWPELSKIDDLKLSLYFLKHSEKLSTKRGSPDIEKVKERILKSISEIEKEYFPPVPSPLCSYCSYRNICPMFSHLYKKETPQEKEVKSLINEYFDIRDKSDNNAIELAKIKKQINCYLEEKGIDRVFGEKGFIAKTKQVKQDYDLDKVREILEEYNLLDIWNKILLPDKKKLELVLKDVSPDISKKLLVAKTKKRTSSIIRAVKKSLAKIQKELE